MHTRRPNSAGFLTITEQPPRHRKWTHHAP